MDSQQPRALPSPLSPSITPLGSLLTALGRGALCTLPRSWGHAGTTSSAESAEHRRGLITAKPRQIRQMQLGGLISRAQPRTATHLPRRGKNRDACYPGKAAAELAPITAPAEVAIQHPQGHTQSSCTAVKPGLVHGPAPAVVEWSFTASATPGPSVGCRYAEVGQMVSSLCRPQS